MKVLLAIPPDTHNLEIYRILGVNAPPLGLAYIAAVLERAGYCVRIVDSPTLKLVQERFIDIVREFKPDIVGFSLITPLAPKGYEIARKLKELFPETILVAGGQHPTFMYNEVLSHGFDVVVRFEGEYTTLELVKTIERYGHSVEVLKSVKSIAFKDREGNIVVTDNRRPIQNLDELPFPARHLLPMDRYTVLGKNIPVAHIMASRGCPYGCIFCSTSYFWGRRIRIRSAANVADEIEHVVNKYKARYIVFTDDELTWSKKWISDLLSELRKRGLDIQFTCGARVDQLQDFDLLKKLVDSGCVGIFVGVESASQNTLNLIGKRITVEQIVRFFENVKRLEQQYKESIDAAGSFIIGFPWETLDDMRQTIDFAVKLDPAYAQFTIATPYPGTPLYDYAVKHNLIIDWNWEHYTTLKAVMKGLHVDAKIMEKLLREAYKKFYVRAKYLLREAIKGRVFLVLPTIIRSIISWLFE
uniref:Radical SAM protein n=1 Tax=Fervidicoccus fontis TaxID=683846 RepID=A0A7C1HX71_9CREN